MRNKQPKNLQYLARVSRSRKRRRGDEEQTAQEPPVSNTGASTSRKRRQVDDEPHAFPEPLSLGIAVAQKSPNQRLGSLDGRLNQLSQYPFRYGASIVSWQYY